MHSAGDDEHKEKQSVRMDMSQDVRFLEPMSEHELFVAQKLLCRPISDDGALIEEDSA
jgi:hypothetical protein